MRKPAFCICENKDADQLRGNREADQRLCFHYTDSTIPLLSKSKISSFLPSTVAGQLGLYRTWSKTPKTGFLRTRLIYIVEYYQNVAGQCQVVFFNEVEAVKDKCLSSIDKGLEMRIMNSSDLVCG